MPLTTEKLRGISEELEAFIMEYYQENENCDGQIIEYFTKKISSIEHDDGINLRAEERSLLSKIHDHPSNREALLEEIRRKAEKLKN